MLLARAVADDLPWVRRSLTEIGSTLPEAVTQWAPDPLGVAFAALGALSVGLAVGAFLVSRETAGAFALLAAATTGWFLFPYAEVPWATVFTAAGAQTVQAPASTWFLGGAIVALATLELVASAREQLLLALEHRGLPAGPDTPVNHASRRASRTLGLLTLLVGGLLALLYAAWRDALGASLPGDPDLLWVPVGLGIALAGVLWFVARRRVQA